MAKKESWVSKLKEDARLLLKGKKGTKHSPAGRRYLAGRAKKKKEETKKTEQVYFRGKGFSRPTIEEQLKGNIDEKMLKRLKGKK